VLTDIQTDRQTNIQTDTTENNTTVAVRVIIWGLEMTSVSCAKIRPLTVSKRLTG